MYQLLTDSCCDLPYQTLHDHHVDFVSMHFTIDGQEYEDDLGEDKYDINAFYQQLKQNVMPTTTQVNVGQFVDFFTPYVEAKTPILYIGFSSGLSGTFDSATQAKAMLLEKHPDAQIYLIDTLAACAGEGQFVLDAIDKRDAGMPIAELAQWLTDHRLHYRMWFTVDKLDFLYHGGRVSRTSAALGTMLNIKPVMDVDTAGKLRVVRKVRARKRSLIDLTDETLKAVKANPTHRVIISTSGDYDAANFVKYRLHAASPETPLQVGNIGPTIASHTGFGCVAVFSMATDDRQ